MTGEQIYSLYIDEIDNYAYDIGVTPYDHDEPDEDGYMVIKCYDNETYEEVKMYIDEDGYIDDDKNIGDAWAEWDNTDFSWIDSWELPKEKGIARFTSAHKDFDRAYEEIKNGYKMSHWMWYIFPQMKGLGMSWTSDYYGIESLEEVREYLKDDTLKEHMSMMLNALLGLSTNDAVHVFGQTDAKKLKSCMTLFNKACKDKRYKKVLRKYFNGEQDMETLKLIGQR